MSEFDHLASSYQELLKDPIRDRFSSGTRFFHERKLLLIEAFWGARGRPMHNLSWLDIGCGKGDLLRLGGSRFGKAMGCDVSTEMMQDSAGLDVRWQPDPRALPFADDSVDFVTAVCVYHHVPPSTRGSLTSEMYRILKPGGVAAIIEHNPWNPATQIIVRRTPIDADAILLRMSEATLLMKAASLRIVHREFFLYLPERLYHKATWLESWGKRVPLGGQYAVFSEKL